MMNDEMSFIPVSLGNKPLGLLNQKTVGNE